MSYREHPMMSVAAQLAPHSYAPGPDPYEHGSGISLAQLFTIVWAYRKLTLGIILASMVGTAVVSKLLPKTYEATVTLMVDYEVNDPLGGKEFPVGLMGSYMSTQTQLIRSPAVLLPVVERLNLTEDEDYIDGFYGSGTKSEWVRNRVTKKLKVEQGEWGSQLIYITYAAESAEEAALVANTIAEVYAQQQFLRLTGPASDRAQRYTDQLNELKKGVDVAQQELTSFRQKSKLLDSKEQVDLDLQRLANLEQRLVQVREERREAEAKTIGDNSVRDAVLNSTSIQQLKTNLAVHESQMAEFRETLGPRHPTVVELQAQIANDRRALAAEMAVYSGNAQATVKATRSLEAQLQAEVDETRARLLEKRGVQDEGSKYVRALEAAETLYKSALEGYDQIVLTSGGGYNNVSFVSRATPPVKASKPKVLLNVFLAMIAGTFFGVVGPLCYELLNRRIRCRDDLDRDLGLPVLVEFNQLPALAGAQ